MGSERVAFVGDVQGCGKELARLVRKLENEIGADFHLYAVGDLINRGPENLRALSIVRERAERGRASCVVGNHELAFLRTALGDRALGPLDTFDELLDRKDLDDWVDWIRHWPLVVTGTLGKRRFAMVHAALPPGDALGEVRDTAERIERIFRKRTTNPLRRFLEDASEPGSDRDWLARITSQRTVAKGRWSAKHPDENGGTPWHRRWAEAEPDFGVVYGHWSVQGLHVAPGLRGLDTGCVHHGRGRDGFLTAWVPDPKRRDPFALSEAEDRFVTQRALAKYWKEL